MIIRRLFAWQSLVLILASPAAAGRAQGKVETNKATPPAKVTASAALSKEKASDKIVALRVEPAELVFSDRRESRRLLVVGRTTTGQERDLSRQAKLVLQGDTIKLESDGFLSPLKEGETRVRIQAEGLETEVPVHIRGLGETHPVTFGRDVMPILNKVGCTSGMCHGAAKGKNGFKLSLRGYDPEFDYRALVSDLSGRRFNRTDPAQSLMLLKPTQQIPHGGGLKLEKDSAYYKTILRWISEGTPFGDPVSAQVTKLEVNPPELLLAKSGLDEQLKVI